MASNVYFAKGLISMCLVKVSVLLGNLDHLGYSLAQVFHVITGDDKSVRASGLSCCSDQVKLRLIGLLVKHSDGTHQCIDVVVLKRSGSPVHIVVVGGYDFESGRLFAGLM